MPSASRTLLWYLIAGTRGGPNRFRILEELQDHPHNAHQLSEALAIDYRTIRHHLGLLERNGLVYRPVGRGYAAPYELAPDVAIQFDEIRAIRASGSAGHRVSRRSPRPEPGRLGT
jgi:DNA-binding transcriptional ArsR family regulator